MSAFDRPDCLRAVEALEPCDVMAVARHLGAAWSQRSTVRNYLNDLVHAGDLIVDRDRRPMLFALNHLAPRRWSVVDCTGAPVIADMLRESNAQDEAAELNRSGVPSGRPYRVVPS